MKFFLQFVSVLLFVAVQAAEDQKPATADDVKARIQSEIAQLDSHLTIPCLEKVSKATDIVVSKSNKAVTDCDSETETDKKDKCLSNVLALARKILQVIRQYAIDCQTKSGADQVAWLSDTANVEKLGQDIQIVIHTFVPK